MRTGTEPRTYPNRDKSREYTRKANRLAREKKMNELRKDVKHNRADSNIVLLRDEAGDELIVAVRRGLFGHDRAPIIRVSAEEIAGACEDVKELGGIATKVGVMVLAQLTGHHLSYGAEGLAKALAKFARIDLDALKKEAEASDAGGGGAVSDVPEGTPDGSTEPGGSSESNPTPPGDYQAEGQPA